MAKPRVTATDRLANVIEVVELGQRTGLLSAERGLQLVNLPGPRSHPANHPRALLHYVPDLAHRDVYVCGPEEWADQVRQVALAAGLPPENLHLETFKW